MKRQRNDPMNIHALCAGSLAKTDRNIAGFLVQQLPKYTPGDCTFGLTNPANLPTGRDLVLGPARNCSPIVSVTVTFGLAKCAVGAQGGRQIGDCLTHSGGKSCFSHRGLLFGLAAGVEDDGGHVPGQVGPPSSDRDVQGACEPARGYPTTYGMGPNLMVGPPYVVWGLSLFVLQSV